MRQVLLLSRLLVPVFLGFAGSVIGQDYTIPSIWQNNVSDVSRADRLSIAFEAASDLKQRINQNTGYPIDTINSGEPSNRTVANMLVVLASQDWHSGNSSWKEQVVDNTLAFYESGKEDLDNRQQNIDTATFGLAEIAAYLAYDKNISRLDIAKRNFDIVHGSFVNATDAQNGAYTRPLNTTCGQTLGGLVFFFSNNSDITVHSSGIGSWIALSARLYELTRNTTYLDAAEQSIQFMQTYMIKQNDSSVVVSGSFDPTSCAVGDGNPDDVGFYIEGLSIVANVTSSHTYTHMANELIPAVVSYSKWHADNNGILTADANYCSKGIFIRGILEARLRNPSNRGLVPLIDSYLTVQFNAVQTNALISGHDYASSWRGGSYETTQITTVGQIDALDVLNSAFAIAPMATTPPPHSSSVPTGAIVGAALGGPVVIVALVLGICICLRRRRRAREIPIRDDRIDTMNKIAMTDGDAEGLLTEPFILPAPVHNRSVSPPEKRGSQQRIALLREFLNNGAPGSPPSTSSRDLHIGHNSDAQIRSAGDSDAQQALERSLMLERRLDDLIHTLANQGETESNPPDYDGNVSSNRVLGQDERGV
ncbi:hypothetical protein PENSPDRAFT_749188 [Peniophora sp. CONT]|nr:hypothetical protein PENSPDRAFT_749188 [Peniophora sp. CONT]